MLTITETYNLLRKRYKEKVDNKFYNNAFEVIGQDQYFMKGGFAKLFKRIPIDYKVGHQQGSVEITGHTGYTGVTGSCGGAGVTLYRNRRKFYLGEN